MREKYTDVSYGIASLALTSTGVAVVTTTGGDYHGIAFLAGTNTAIFVYDNPSTAAGNLLDTVFVASGSDKPRTNFVPVKAKNGITVSITGTGGRGTVFFSPKG